MKMEKIYLLICKVDGEIKYWKALSTRPKAEKMKHEFEEFDKVRGVDKIPKVCYNINVIKGVEPHPSKCESKFK